MKIGNICIRGLEATANLAIGHTSCNQSINNIDIETVSFLTLRSI